MSILQFPQKKMLLVSALEVPLLQVGSHLRQFSRQMVHQILKIITSFIHL